MEKSEIGNLRPALVFWLCHRLSGTRLPPPAHRDYWNAADAAMLKFFIDTGDARIEADRIAHAQDAGDTPECFALWFGENA